MSYYTKRAIKTAWDGHKAKDITCHIFIILLKSNIAMTLIYIYFDKTMINETVINSYNISMSIIMETIL